MRALPSMIYLVDYHSPRRSASTRKYLSYLGESSHELIKLFREGGEFTVTPFVAMPRLGSYYDLELQKHDFSVNLWTSSTSESSVWRGFHPDHGEYSTFAFEIDDYYITYETYFSYRDVGVDSIVYSPLHHSVEKDFAPLLEYAEVLLKYKKTESLQRICREYVDFTLMQAISWHKFLPKSSHDGFLAIHMRFQACYHNKFGSGYTRELMWYNHVKSSPGGPDAWLHGKP